MTLVGKWTHYSVHQVVIQHVVQGRLWINSWLECTWIILLLANYFLILSLFCFNNKTRPFHKKYIIWALLYWYMKVSWNANNLCMKIANVFPFQTIWYGIHAAGWLLYRLWLLSYTHTATCNSCNTGMSALPDKYVRHLRVRSTRGKVQTYLAMHECLCCT